MPAALSSRWLGPKQGFAHFLHLAMACQKSGQSQCVGDVALVTEQRMNTRTRIQRCRLRLILGYQCVSVRLISNPYHPCSCPASEGAVNGFYVAQGGVVDSAVTSNMVV